MFTDKVYFLPEYGILPGSGQDCSQELQHFFNNLPDNSAVHFKTGIYQILKPIEIQNKINIKIFGHGATVIAHFNPCGPIAENNDVFCFTDCENITVSGLRFETDNPIGATGTVTAIDFENKTVDLLIEDEFPVTGYEHFCGINSFDELGSPDYALVTYNNAIESQPFINSSGEADTRQVGLDYELTGDQQVRLKLGADLDEKESCRLTLGHQINIRYEIYGTSIFIFRSCRQVLLKQIDIYSAASFGATILPRSSDFTFDNFNIILPEGTKRLKAANADGVHILGLSGKLIFKDCYIEGLGDDTLNIHGLAMLVKEADAAGGSLKMTGRNNRAISHAADWAMDGDRIIVYDSKTFLEKGSFTVSGADTSGNIKFYDLKGQVQSGDVLANSTYFAAVHLDGCTLRSTRARGILIQSHDVLIENCYIYGMSLSAMLFAPDIQNWWEVGPAKRVEIRNNIIEHCAHIKHPANKGAIIFKSSHDADGIHCPAGVHEKIYIHKNQFINIPNCGIFISSAKNVRIEDNIFSNCGYKPYDSQDLFGEYDIAVLHCEEVTVKNNSSSRGEEKLLYLEDVK